LGGLQPAGDEALEKDWTQSGRKAAGKNLLKKKRRPGKELVGRGTRKAQHSVSPFTERIKKREYTDLRGHIFKKGKLKPKKRRKGNPIFSLLRENGANRKKNGDSNWGE